MEPYPELPFRLILPGLTQTHRLTRSEAGPEDCLYRLSYSDRSLYECPAGEFFTQSFTGFKSGIVLLTFSVSTEVTFEIAIPRNINVLSYFLEGDMTVYFNRVRVNYYKEKNCTALYAPKGSYTVKVQPGHYSLLTVIPSRREFHTLTDAGKAISYLIEEQNRGGSYAKIVTPGRIDDTSYHIFDGMQTMNPQTKGEIEIIVMHSCSGLITAFRVYRKTLSDSPLYQAIDYINDHLPGNDLINIPAIARQFYISYWTFLNQFKQLMGITIRNYIIYERLKAAHELLTTTDMPINKVAERVGYNDPVQFNKDFKHHMNYTPGSLRK